MCALTHDMPISEHELFLGTIVSAARNNKQKMDSAGRLAEFTGVAFAPLRRAVGGGRTGTARVERCWAAWCAVVDDVQEGWGLGGHNVRVGRAGWVEGGPGRVG